MKQNNIMKNTYSIIVAGMIGLVAALIIYGILPLDVTNDKWIYNGYMEPDLIQHYAGWLNYRNSDWCFPLGKIQGIGNYSNYISFTDSIPLFAIGFKLLSSILPETFQYFGIYIFFCFILQGVFAYKILDCFIKEKSYKYIAIILFLLSPVMLERAFRHTALASHWLILASIYLYLKGKKRERISYYYILLMVLAILIHPYFLPMICAFMAAGTLEQLFSKKLSKEVIINIFSVWISSIILCGIVGYSIGLFGWIDAVQLNTLGGYGYFTTDLNSVINPISLGYTIELIPEWSTILPVRNYAVNTFCDGFNYLGIAVLISFPVLLTFCLIKRNLFNLKKYWGYVTVTIILIVYSYSNTIWLDGNIIFTYNVPKFLYPIFSSFKSSGRYFWPVSYTIIIFIVVSLYRLVTNLNAKKLEYDLRNILICLIVGCQIIDLSKIIISKHQFFEEEKVNSIYSTYILYGSFDEYVDDNCKYIAICDPGYDPSLMYKISFLAGKNNLINNFNIVNRGEIKELRNESIGLICNAIKEGHLDSNYMYLFLEKNNAEIFVNCMSSECEILEIEESNIGNISVGLCKFYVVKETASNSDSDLIVNKIDDYRILDGNYNIEETKIDEKSISFNGWAYIQNMNSDNQEAYAKVEYINGVSKYYPTFKNTRADIGNAFGDEKYNDSGFSVFMNDDINTIKCITLVIANEKSAFLINLYE